MLAEIITIGDEILIGQIVDTNSAYIAKELNKIGIDVFQITSVSDNKQHILNALSQAQNKVNLVLITGGLGPTKDDITKQTFCDYFKDTLVQNDQVLDHIEKLFEKYLNQTPKKVNRLQALVPSKAEVIFNEVGTAPGMWMEHQNTVFVSMPGVPFEMKTMLSKHLIPKLQERFERPYIIHKTILTYGQGESTVAERIEKWENELPNFIKLAYLPNLGKVRLRLSARGENKELLEQTISTEVEKLKNIIGDIIFGYEGEESMESTIAKILAKNKLTLAVAESCTGGKIASCFTVMQGASAYFKGGIVPYDTLMKIKILGVDAKLIEQHSVVSIAVAEAMAANTLKKFESDFSIAVTGNAGPTKGDSDADVGTVCIAIATPNGIKSEQFLFSNSRTRTIGKAVNKVLEMLYNEVLHYLKTNEESGTSGAEI